MHKWYVTTLLIGQKVLYEIMGDNFENLGFGTGKSSFGSGTLIKFEQNMD